MQGLSFQSLKKHPSLIPLFVALGAGVVMSVAYTFRLAIANPDVTWDRKKNPEPWQHYAEKQYKLFYPTTGFKPTKVPQFEEKKE